MNKKIIITVVFCFILIPFFGFISSNNAAVEKDSLDVLHYGIHLNISNFTKQEISGFTEIKLTTSSQKPLFISLDLLQLNVDSVYLNNKKTNFTYLNSTILLNSKIKQLETANIIVYYRGKPQHDKRWGGFYFTGNSAYNYGVGMAAEPPCFGRCWFPCVDNFTDKAKYDFYITTENKNTAVCNGILLETKKNSDNTKTFHWQLNQPINTYLAAVAVSDFVEIKGNYKNSSRTIPYSIFCSKSDSSKAVSTFANLSKWMQIYEKYFGEYVWQRIGYVSVPFFGGAMEHATNISVSNTSIDGTNNSEYLFAHELSHHWFGDLVTCKTEQDMWLNEGWARYCETLIMNDLYGYEFSKTYSRKNHFNVLLNSHLEDKSYLPVYGIQHENTYGSTVYDKGADVVLSLRNYLGDSLFFSTTKKYLQHFAFQSVSTEEMISFFSTTSGIELTDFANSWLYEKGFVHFSVDTFKPTPKKNGFNVQVFVRQRIKERNTYAKSNEMDITFMNKSWKQETQRLKFSGEAAKVSFSVPFKPDIIMLDLDEKVADATTDFYKIIKGKGRFDYKTTYFVADIQEISDSIFLRSELNWVAPDQLQHEIGCSLPKNRYWKIDGIVNEKTKINGEFYFDFNEIDKTEESNYSNNLVLLYRPNPWKEWKVIDTERKGTGKSGLLLVQNLQLGEYTLAFKK